MQLVLPQITRRLGTRIPASKAHLPKGATSTALDVVGLLPEGGAVASAFSLWHGAAGVSNGINIPARVQFGAAIISTASAGSDASGDGAFSLAGAQLATGFNQLGLVSQRLRRLWASSFRYFGS
jgi:hypothetical protein